MHASFQNLCLVHFGRQLYIVFSETYEDTASAFMNSTLSVAQGHRESMYLVGFPRLVTHLGVCKSIGCSQVS